MKSTCSNCEGKGIYPAANGPEDSQLVFCDCGAIPLTRLDFFKRCEALNLPTLIV